MASERAVKSSSSGGVFQKAMLSLSSDVAKECRGKQKRKAERLPKPKSTGQKATASRRQKNHLTQAKTKTQMNRENDKGSACAGKATKSGVAETLNLLRNPKAVSSEPINNAKRKVLGAIQSSRVGSGLKPAAASTGAKVNTDLRKVLATSGEEKVSSTSASDSKTTKRTKKGLATVATREAGKENARQRGDKNGSKQSQTSRPSSTESASSSDMDSSSRTAGVPLREISLRLVEGLQTKVIFPESDYLGNVKAELKKLMKQSDPEAYAQLMLCISDKHEDTPAINAAILAATQDTSIGGFDIQSSGFFDDSNSIPADSNPLQTLFGSAPDSLPGPDPPQATTSSTVAVLQPSTSGHHCDAAALLPPVMHQVSTATSNHHPITHLNVSPMPFHLPTVICHSDIEPSAADNMLSQQQTSLNMDISHMSFSSISAGPPLPPPSVDFLDYLDAGSLDSASDVQYNVAIATGPGDEGCEGGNPINHHWVTVSPERPRMFPRKLY